MGKDGKKGDRKGREERGGDPQCFFHKSDTECVVYRVFHKNNPLIF